MSSIPSYDGFGDMVNTGPTNGGVSRKKGPVPIIPGIGKSQTDFVNNNMTEEELRTLAEEGQMLFDDHDDIDLKDLDIGDSDRL